MHQKMETKKNYFNNSICNTCLSADRNLFAIKHSLLPSEIQNISQNKKDKNICWECKANINKIVEFTQRALMAHQLLSSVIQDNEFKTLSTLTVSKKDTYDAIVTNRNKLPFEYVDEHENLEMKLETHEDSELSVKRDGLDLSYKADNLDLDDQNPSLRKDPATIDTSCIKDVLDPDSTKDAADLIISIKEENQRYKSRDLLIDKDHKVINKSRKISNRNVVRRRQVKKEEYSSISNEPINKQGSERNRKNTNVRKKQPNEEDQFDDSIIEDDPTISDTEIEEDSNIKRGEVKKGQNDNIDESIIKENLDERDGNVLHNKRTRVRKKVHDNKLEINIDNLVMKDYKHFNSEKVDKTKTMDKNGRTVQENISVKEMKDIIPKTNKDKEKQLEKNSYEPNSYIVSSLTEEELFYLRDKQRNSTIYKRHVHKCDSCILGFRTSEKLKEHFAEFHSELLGSYICDICQQRHSDLDRHIEHKKCHFNIYKCTLCKHKNFNLNSILLHTRNNHSREYSCTTCDLTFQSKGAARYHIKTHNLQECKLCGKEYADLKIHMVSHNKSRTEKCNICQKLLKSKTSLRFHLLTHTTARKDEAYCTECDVQFKSKHIYRMHLKTNAKHTVPDKECDYCHRKFISKFTLAKHISVVHYNKLDHICHLCGKKFSIAGHLRNHISVHHEGLSKPKKHVCDLCGKGFAVKKCLTDHVNTHTGARPYKCLVCSAQFGFKSALYMHNRLKHLKGKKGKQKVEFTNNLDYAK